MWISLHNWLYLSLHRKLLLRKHQSDVAFTSLSNRGFDICYAGWWPTDKMNHKSEANSFEWLNFDYLHAYGLICTNIVLSWLRNTILGGMAVCNGLGYMLPVRLEWKVYPEHSGLVSGIIIGGFGLGSLIFTYGATLIVNPDNLTSVISKDGLISFPESVALMVPVLIRWLAAGYTIFLITSLLLIKEPSFSKFTEL